MTHVVIKKPTTSNIPINEIEIGYWYKITRYIHNHNLIGEIGVAVSLDGQRHIVTPAGDVYGHGDIVVSELNQVYISYEEQ